MSCCCCHRESRPLTLQDSRPILVSEEAPTGFKHGRGKRMQLRNYATTSSGFLSAHSRFERCCAWICHLATSAIDHNEKQRHFPNLVALVILSLALNRTMRKPAFSSPVWFPATASRDKLRINKKRRGIHGSFVNVILVGAVECLPPTTNTSVTLLSTGREELHPFRYVVVSIVGMVTTRTLLPVIEGESSKAVVGFFLHVETSHNHNNRTTKDLKEEKVHHQDIQSFGRKMYPREQEKTSPRFLFKFGKFSEQLSAAWETKLLISSFPLCRKREHIRCTVDLGRVFIWLR